MDKMYDTMVFRHWTQQHRAEILEKRKTNEVSPTVADVLPGQFSRSPCREGKATEPSIAEAELGLQEGRGWVDFSDQSTGKQRAEPRTGKGLERKETQREGSRHMLTAPSVAQLGTDKRVCEEITYSWQKDLKKAQAGLNPQSSQGPETVCVPTSQNAKPGNKQGRALRMNWALQGAKSVLD